MVRAKPQLVVLALVVGPLLAGGPHGRTAAAEPRRGEGLELETHQYLVRLTQSQAEASRQRLESEPWERLQPRLRFELAQMLGLDPMPDKGDLRPVVTGTAERDGIKVDRLVFQSSPGLYVTANFFYPAQVNGKLPTILYLCGHGQTKIGGVSFGNKVTYHHHAAWFASNGYACLVLDTLQLGEIEGQHHGTYRLGRWWWTRRGYTPAGVEAWNAIRALDYLATRPEVDGSRIGVTGRSGGGAYSWWLAALDDRVRCLVPVAGITDMANHVVDGCIEGHCDCMYMINRYRWDFPLVAALAAPRPTLLANSDKDTIFPLDGVVRIHEQLASHFRARAAPDKLGLLITEGPHSDTQDLQVPTFRWMNRWLRQTDEPVREPAEKLFSPEELKVLVAVPADQRNTTLDESFVPIAPIPPVPASMVEWLSLKDRWLGELRSRCFSGWPTGAGPLDLETKGTAHADGMTLEVLHYNSEEGLRWPIYVLRPKTGQSPSMVLVRVVDDDAFAQWRAGLPGELANLVPAASPSAEVQSEVDPEPSTLARYNWARAIVAPRGWGPSRWLTAELDAEARAKAVTHLRRRLVLLGRTEDEGRVWDTMRAARALRSRPGWDQVPVWLGGEGPAAPIALFAALFEPSVARVDLWKPSLDPRSGPYLIELDRILTLPQAAALAFPRPVHLHEADPGVWAWTKSVADLHDPLHSPLWLAPDSTPNAAAKPTTPKGADASHR